MSDQSPRSPADSHDDPTIDATPLSELAAHVENFVRAWETEAAPIIEEFLPDGSNATFRRLVLIELVKADLEYRTEFTPVPKRLAGYLAEFPELNREGVPIDLIYEEYHLRRRTGEDVDPTDYIAAFPDHAEELARLFQIHGSVDEQEDPDDRSELDRLVVPDRIDDFDLMAELGRGAFARVFLARQRSMQRLVALKISENRGVEAQTLARLDHHAIVRVFDVRDLSHRGLRLLYMQYLAGGTLQSVTRFLQSTERTDWSGQMFLGIVDESLTRRGAEQPRGSYIRTKLESYDWPATICWIGSELGRGLDYAHERGVLHRDIKPANVLLSSEGVPKLADFNISFSSQTEGTTPAAYFGGSLAYMSPEQLRACHPGHAIQPDALDERSDLYSLAVMLWELLTSQHPFGSEAASESWTETLDRMIDRRTRPPREIDLPDEIPAGLSRVLCRCLAPDRDDRPSSGNEFARQLELCLHPRAERLLNPRSSRFRKMSLQCACVVYFLCAAVPNGLAGWFNFVYNKRMIINHMSDQTQSAFMTIQTIINIVAFPVGLGLAGWLIWPVIRWVWNQNHLASPRSLSANSPEGDGSSSQPASSPTPQDESTIIAVESHERATVDLSGSPSMVPSNFPSAGTPQRVSSGDTSHDGSPFEPERLPDLEPAPLEFRHRTLKFGSWIAAISVIEWLLAGLAYPVALRVSSGELTELDSIHFLGSLVICGLIAAAYPFFLATTFGMRVIYPVLRAGRPDLPEDRERLVRLTEQSPIYLVLGLAPMLGVFCLALIGSEARFALIILSICGLAGFGLLMKLHAQLRADCEALLELDDL